MEEYEILKTLCLSHEDDGHLFWDREHCVCFDAAWLDSYIDTMSGLKKLLRRCE